MPQPLKPSQTNLYKLIRIFGSLLFLIKCIDMFLCVTVAITLYSFLPNLTYSRYFPSEHLPFASRPVVGYEGVKRQGSKATFQGDLYEKERTCSSSFLTLPDLSLLLPTTLSNGEFSGSPPPY